MCPERGAMSGLGWLAEMGQVKLPSTALHQVHSGGCSPSARALQTLA